MHVNILQITPNSTLFINYNARLGVFGYLRRFCTSSSLANPVLGVNTTNVEEDSSDQHTAI